MSVAVGWNNCAAPALWNNKDCVCRVLVIINHLNSRLHTLQTFLPSLPRETQKQVSALQDKQSPAKLTKLSNPLQATLRKIKESPAKWPKLSNPLLVTLRTVKTALSILRKTPRWMTRSKQRPIRICHWDIDVSCLGSTLGSLLR